MTKETPEKFARTVLRILANLDESLAVLHETTAERLHQLTGEPRSQIRVRILRQYKKQSALNAKAVHQGSRALIGDEQAVSNC